MITRPGVPSSVPPVSSPAEELTPSGNTGLNRQKTAPNAVAVHLDWLNVVAPLASLAALRPILDFVTGFTGDELTPDSDRPIFRGERFAGSGLSPQGVAVAFNPPGEGERPGKVWFSIPGRVMSAMSARNQWRLLQGLRHRFNGRATRIDIALDDFEKRVRPEQVAAVAAKRGASGVESWECITAGRGSKRGGSTCYLGSKESYRRLVVYDKEAESDGEVDSIRWELRLKDKLAAEFWDSVTAQHLTEYDESLWTDALAGQVVGAVDFIKRHRADRAKGGERYVWWQSLVDDVGTRLRVAAPKVVMTAAKSWKWIKSQVLPTLSVLASAVGPGFRVRFDRLLVEQKDFWGLSHNDRAVVWGREVQQQRFVMA